MYTVDAYLFAEPLADVLGRRCGAPASAPASTWSSPSASPDGSALAWGRSIGALAVCHTAELAGARPAPRPRGRRDGVRWPWRRRGRRRRTGLVLRTGSSRRTSTGRRSATAGPFRRLQMTLDCLGKLAAAAADLRAADVPAIRPSVPGPRHSRPSTAGSPSTSGAPGCGPTARVASGSRCRSSAASCPTTRPAPRSPGLFEVPGRPADADLGAGGAPAAPPASGPAGGPPRSSTRPDALALTHDRLRALDRPRRAGDDPAELAGRRTATYEVIGRTLACIGAPGARRGARRPRRHHPGGRAPPAAGRRSRPTTPTASIGSTPTASPSGAALSASCPSCTSSTSSRPARCGSAGRSRR